MKAIAVCAAGGGLTTALAVAHDILRLLALHTATAHTAFAALHNLHRWERKKESGSWFCVKGIWG